MSQVKRPERAFSLIELIIVIVILGVLAAFALPKYAELGSAARVASLNGIAGSMRSTIAIIRGKAKSQGLVVTGANPSDQSIYIVETEAGSSEVDWRNLCPESRAELADQLSMADHIGLSDSEGLEVIINNQYTRVGYDIQGTGAPTTNGCYVTYDSFGNPECTVTVIDTDC